MNESFRLIEFNVYDSKIEDKEDNENFNENDDDDKKKNKDEKEFIIQMFGIN